MRIAKPLLLVLTPIGVVVGLIEGYRVAGGLVVLMAGMLLIVSVAAVTVVMAIRRERREQSARAGTGTEVSKDREARDK
jgi:uncharacterized protein (DUF58 family)